ncbi:MAG: CRISPR-associated endoribonuclease Cas6 [Synergistaceae bacterium]|nr:CRISPR-associated endoribonuclease Cas6 [Synergistaceae bacterium]
MHVTLYFSSPKTSSIRLPSANLHMFQAMLYSLLPPQEADVLHNQGFNSDGKKMKLFAMSWPIASSLPQFGDETVVFPLPIKLVVTTPIESLISGFSGGALSSGTLKIGNNFVECGRVETEQQIANSESMTIKTLSPVTCYISNERDGRPYTRYLSPYDDINEFQRSIYFNLVRKFRLIYPDRDIPGNEFKIIPVGNLKQRISMYDKKKNGIFPIKGWWGKFRLEGPLELLQIALDCGLGAKNSSGWGCVTKCDLQTHMKC